MLPYLVCILILAPYVVFPLIFAWLQRNAPEKRRSTKNHVK